MNRSYEVYEYVTHEFSVVRTSLSHKPGRFSHTPSLFGESFLDWIIEVVGCTTFGLADPDG